MFDINCSSQEPMINAVDIIRKNPSAPAIKRSSFDKQKTHTIKTIHEAIYLEKNC